MSTDKLLTSGLPRIAIVGAGYMAQEHLRSFSGLAKVVGITSRSRVRAQALCESVPNCSVFESISDMYEGTRADAAVIAVPELQLPHVLNEATRHPWVLLVEKPFGINPAETGKLISLALARNTQVYVALNRRHFSSTRRLLELLSENHGRRVIEIQDQQDINAAALSGQPQEVIRNWMFANSIHLIDLINVMGRGDVIHSISSVEWNEMMPFYVSTHFEFDSGDVASYSCLWNMPGPWSCAVTTSEARYEMRPLESLSIQTKGSRVREEVELGRLDFDFKPGLRIQAAELVSAVRGESTLLPDLTAYARSTRLVQLAYGQE